MYAAEGLIAMVSNSEASAGASKIVLESHVRIPFGRAPTPDRWMNDFEFRGNRQYIHSASICNHLQRRFGSVKRFDINFRSWMKARVVFWTGNPPVMTSPDGLVAKGDFQFISLDGTEVRGCFSEDSVHPTLSRLPWDEDGLVFDATVVGNIIFCPAREQGSFVDRIIAANKKLINSTLNPGVKLVASRLKLDFFPPDDVEFQLRLDSHLGHRMFKSSLLIGSNKEGEVLYYGQ